MDIKKVKQIIELFEESKVAKMDLEIEDIKIKLEKACVSMESAAIPVVQNVTPVEAVKKEEIEETNVSYVKSPLVGTFYQSPAQGAAPFVKVGSKINAGDVVCIIEAMKVMNEIRADQSGIVKEILVKDGEMVHFDQAMIVIGE